MENSLIGLLERFPDETSCINYLEKLLWKNVPKSPFSPKSKVYKCKYGYVCGSTGKRFNVKHGTIFHGSKIPLKKWFLAIYMFTSHKRGISSVQMSKYLGLRQPTAWKMLTKIRDAMKFYNAPSEHGDTIWQIDETCFGGKYKNKHTDKKMGPTGVGRSYLDKHWVVGMLQEKGNVVLQAVPNTQQTTLQTIVWNTIPLGSVVITDEWRGYFNLKDDYAHGIVQHNERQYTNGWMSTNGIESFWSHMKRMYHGTYYHITEKYTQKYCNEAAFRFNTRDMMDFSRFEFMVEFC